MTNLLLLIGAGLFSRATAAFETNAFNHIVGANVDDTGGTGPGSYRVQGNVWHLDCCSASSGQNWSIFNAILGWDNNATSNLWRPCNFFARLLTTSIVGTVLSYISYWVAVIAALIYLKFKEVSSATVLCWNIITNVVTWYFIGKNYALWSRISCSPTSHYASQLRWRGGPLGRQQG
jgi:high-affinity Fe2+/Pb2+ permease